MTPKRSFPNADSLTLYASKKIVEWLAVGPDEHGRRTQERLAKAAHVTGATIHAVRTRSKTIGMITARGLAPALGMTLEEFVANALRESVPQPKPEAAPDPSDADLHFALGLARDDGVVEPEFIQAYTTARPHELRGRALLDDLLSAWRTWRRSGRLPEPSFKPSVGQIRIHGSPECDTFAGAQVTVSSGGDLHAGDSESRLAKAERALRSAKKLVAPPPRSEPNPRRRSRKRA